MYLKTVSIDQCSILSLSLLVTFLGALLLPDFPMKLCSADLSSAHFSAGVLVFLGDLHLFSSSIETVLAASGRVSSSLVHEAWVASSPCPSSGMIEEMK